MILVIAYVVLVLLGPVVFLCLVGLDRDDRDGGAGIRARARVWKAEKMERGDWGGGNGCALVRAVAGHIGGGMIVFRRSAFTRHVARLLLRKRGFGLADEVFNPNKRNMT